MSRRSLPVWNATENDELIVRHKRMASLGARQWRPQLQHPLLQLQRHQSKSQLEPVEDARIVVRLGISRPTKSTYVPIVHKSRRIWRPHSSLVTLALNRTESPIFVSFMSPVRGVHANNLPIRLCPMLNGTMKVEDSAASNGGFGSIKAPSFTS